MTSSHTFSATINEALLSGNFPSIFMSALVRPLLKKISWPWNLEKLQTSFPSIISFKDHKEKRPFPTSWTSWKINNTLFHSHQFAYRSDHSAETALLKIVNDNLTALDDSHLSLLSLLDLPAAFDTIDHETLLSRLHHTFGISDTTLSWFRSYHFDRTQVVSVNGNSSSPSVITFGVPQGSVPDPILLCSILNTLRHCTPTLPVSS